MIAAIERAKKEGVFVITTAPEFNYGFGYNGLGRGTTLILTALTHISLDCSGRTVYIAAIIVMIPRIHFSYRWMQDPMRALHHLMGMNSVRRAV